MSTARILGSVVAVQKSNLTANELLNDDNFDFASYSQNFKNSESVEIDLRDNLLGIKTAEKIATWLESGDAPKKVSINLNANAMDDKCAKLLTKAAASPQAPAELTLNLGLNNITDAGAKHCAKTFKFNENKLNLLLTSNSITAKGARILELEKRIAPTLLNIDLAGNALEEVTVAQFRRS